MDRELAKASLISKIKTEENQKKTWIFWKDIQFKCVEIRHQKINNTLFPLKFCPFTIY
ncbi:hypothetical protein BpHYR1_002760 [Brachionus plicatilis]|uniref:Uncharacterized protein n=1 Tax=Brachionus plicatilis TaxID=10195 RepID=A0A3M7PCG2_BRAPC|nr:hypothetical protein BpHYR1_002760 [Brachionus plicatilis]